MLEVEAKIIETQNSFACNTFLAFNVIRPEILPALIAQNTLLSSLMLYASWAESLAAEFQVAFPAVESHLDFWPRLKASMIFLLCSSSSPV